MMTNVKRKKKLCNDKNNLFHFILSFILAHNAWVEIFAAYIFIFLRFLFTECLKIKINLTFYFVDLWDV